MKMKNHIKYLNSLNACGEAIEYAKKFDTLQEAWNVCERGDWMLWLIGRQSGKPGSEKRKKLVLIVCKCIRSVLRFIPKNEKRPLKAIQITEAWAKNKKGITLEDVRNAAADAADANAIYTAATAATIYAIYAADAADAYAIYTAATAATIYAIYVAEKRKTLKKYADIVRKFYPVINDYN